MDLLPLVDVVVGMLLLTAIGLAAARTQKARSLPQPIGWSLLLGLPVAVGAHLVFAMPPAADQAAFLVGAALFAVGTAVVLTSDDDRGDDRPSSDLDPAPWWPDFERQFRAYDRDLSRVRAR